MCVCECGVCECGVCVRVRVCMCVCPVSSWPFPIQVYSTVVTKATTRVEHVVLHVLENDSVSVDVYV